MSLIIPASAAPTNFRSDGTEVIDSDVFNICERLREISRSLVLRYDHAQEKFIVSEVCEDGVERFVKKYDELTPQIESDMRYLLGVPFAERVKELERENEKFEQQFHEDEMDRLWYQLGEPMLHQLHKDGFTDHNPKSYAKRGVNLGKS